MSSSSPLRQPNIVVFAVLVAGLAGFVLASPGPAPASSGGLTIGSPESGAGPADNRAASRFGHRVLREGMSGSDVKILKGIARAKSLLRRTRVSERFDRPTTSAVRRFQRKSNMRSSGVVNRATAKRMVRSLRRAGASWYGPGLWGNRTACGKVLRPNTMGVAHKTLPCGSKVLIGYHGRYVMTRVIDRGPYIRGRAWDLTLAVSDALRFTPVGAGPVRSAVVKRAR